MLNNDNRAQLPRLKWSVLNKPIDYKRVAGGALNERVACGAIVTFSVRFIVISDLKPSSLHKANPVVAANARNIAKKEMTCICEEVWLCDEPANG